MCPHEHFRFKSQKELITAIDDLGLSIPFSNETEVLGQPVTVWGKVIPNRIAAHPMEGCDGIPGGKPGELTFRRYKRIAGGGAGLLWFEATAVVHEGRANPRQLLLAGDNLMDFRNLLECSLKEAEEKYGSEHRPYTVIQLTHSGRYSRPESEPCPIIAVRNPYLDSGFDGDKIHTITDEELEELEERFADAAVMAWEAGFDAVDIKSCHGYLNSELLSARTREGRYGGSFENRTMFLTNIIDRIRAKSKDGPAITVRLSAYDGIPFPYGWGVDRENHLDYDISEPLCLVKLLREKGVKLINITAGNSYYNPHIGRPYDTGPYVPSEHPLSGVERMLKICREILKAVPDMTVVATGLSWLREFGANCAAGGIHEGWFTLAGFGRQFFAYPDFPGDIFTKRGMDRKKCCITCGKCSEIMRYDGMAGCVIRDAAVYRPIYCQVSDGKKKLVQAQPSEHV